MSLPLLGTVPKCGVQGQRLIAAGLFFSVSTYGGEDSLLKELRPKREVVTPKFLEGIKGFLCVDVGGYAGEDKALGLEPPHHLKCPTFRPTEVSERLDQDGSP